MCAPGGTVAGVTRGSYSKVSWGEEAAGEAASGSWYKLGGSEAGTPTGQGHGGYARGGGEMACFLHQ